MPEEKTPEKSQSPEQKFVTISEVRDMARRFPDDGPVGAMRGLVLLLCDHIYAIEETVFHERTGLVRVAAGLVKRSEVAAKNIATLSKDVSAIVRVITPPPEEQSAEAAPSEPDEPEGMVEPTGPSRVTPATPPPSAGPAKPPVTVVSAAVPGQPPAPPPAAK